MMTAIFRLRVPSGTTPFNVRGRAGLLGGPDKGDLVRGNAARDHEPLEFGVASKLPCSCCPPGRLRSGRSSGRHPVSVGCEAVVGDRMARPLLLVVSLDVPGGDGP